MRHDYCTRKSLEKIDDQLGTLGMRPISGPLEERVAVAAVREAGADGLLMIVQVALAGLGVIAAAIAIYSGQGFLAIYITAAVLIYAVLAAWMQVRRGRRVAVRAVLDYRINRSAAVYAATSGGDH